MMNKLKAAMMSRAMKLMTDPKVMKFLANPKVTQMLIGAMMAKGKAEEMWNDRARLIARQLNLATQAEVDSLKSELDFLRNRVSKN